jgi:hypothetical protein
MRDDRNQRAAVRLIKQAATRAGLTRIVGKYNTPQIAWELQETASGNAYHGNALRVAKDVPGVTDDDRALLDRYATGANRGTDHVALQDLALRIRYGAPRTCDNCAQSVSKDPKCGLCAGPTSTITRWEPKP